METLRDFFTLENLHSLFVNAYNWIEGLLTRIFGKMGYEPLRNLFTNPWFWIIILALFLLSLIFRRR
jgi:hypothetical protein